MFNKTFDEIKQQIEKYPELITQNEGAIELAFQERKIDEIQRKELLILLLEMQYSGKDHPDRTSEFINLQIKVIKLFPDFRFTYDFKPPFVGFDELFHNYIIFKLSYEGLKFEHVAVLGAYTLKIYFTHEGYGFHVINEELRNSRPSHLTLRITKLMNEALDCLPNYKGIVYRSFRIDTSEFYKEGDTTQGDDRIREKIKEQHPLGSIFVNNQFMSCSAEKPVFGGHVRYIINSKNGKFIDDISGYGEKEVLFKPGTKFKVINYIPNEFYPLLIIYLEEVI